MKKFMSLILATVLVIAVISATFTGVVAGFYDVEHSTDNYLCAATKCLEVSGSPFAVVDAWPCDSYSQEYILLNTGSMDGIAYIHFPDEDDPDGKWQGISCEEAGTINGMVYDGNGYRQPTGLEPEGADVATTESELSAEEGGVVGEKDDGTPVEVDGLGTDTCNLADFLEVKVWFDGDLKVDGTLSEIACTDWELGLIPASPGVNEGNNGGGWGSYFTYHVGDEPIEVSLVGGQVYSSGIVTISNDDTNLYVEYNTSPDWMLTETHVYVGSDPPPKLSPGKFKEWGGDQHDPISPPSKTDSYIFPLADILDPPYECNDIYLAVHAVVCHPDYGCQTGWGKGVYRKVKIELHLPDIDEDDLDLHYFDENIPAEAKWDHWPTNAYMGDQCIFDIVFKLPTDDPNNNSGN